MLDQKSPVGQDNHSNTVDGQVSGPELNKPPTISLPKGRDAIRGLGCLEQMDTESYGKFEQGNSANPHITDNKFSTSRHSKPPLGVIPALFSIGTASSRTLSTNTFHIGWKCNIPDLKMKTYEGRNGKTAFLTAIKQRLKHCYVAKNQNWCL